MALRLRRNYDSSKDGKSRKYERGKIRSFSRKSRNALLWRLQTLDFSLLKSSLYSAYFVTLTYKRSWYLQSRNLRIAKRDLDVFFNKKLRVFLGSDWFSFWKLEFHKSGIPHFHLFLVVPSLYFKSEIKALVMNSWVDVVCSDAPEDVKLDMLAAATRVDSTPLDSKIILMIYISKEIGKTFQVNVPSGELPGRFWGIYNRKLYNSFVTERTFEISTDEQFFRIRRDMRKWLKKKGYNYRFKSPDGMSLYYVFDVSYFERLVHFYSPQD